MSNSEVTTIDIQGIPLEFDLPSGASVTSAIAAINYQYIREDGEVRAGTLWSTSPMTRPEAIGTAHLLKQAIENEEWGQQ